MSGGVDSSVAAHLLREAGHEVTGVFLRLGPSGAAEPRGAHRGCCSIEDSRDAARVASRLGIPYYALNSEGEFTRIIDHFVDEYHRGRTPNPCVLCNQWIKFGSLREKARLLGCDAVATGHYARIDRDREEWRLLRGSDRAKDQSYFLFLMPRDSLQDTLFPVGGLTKPEVREIARSAGLPVAEKPESQEICFVPGNDYREVLRARTPDRLRPGSLVDAEGRRLGEHPGYQSFTIGQRRGIGVAAGKPVYVTAIDPATNTVTIGSREDLRRSEVDVTDVQWTSRAAPAPGEEVRVEAQIRHRATARPGTFTAGARGRAVLRFDEPQDAVTPGQAAVFYCGDVVLGGGWIEAAR